MTQCQDTWRRLHADMDCAGMPHAGVAIAADGTWYYGYADDVYAITDSPHWATPTTACYGRVRFKRHAELQFYRFMQYCYARTN